MAEETKIIRIVIDSSKAVDGSAAATRAYERMERAQGAAVSSLERMERGLGRMGGLLKANLALAIADIGARLIQMGKNAFEAASGLDELAEQLGVTNKFLQASQFLAAQNGVKLEQLEAAYGKFNQKMGEAADGSKEVIEKLEQLGVKNLDLAGKLRPTEDLMQDVAAAIVGIEDPARRAAAAVDFFGKSGTKLLPMMAEIANGADAMAAKMIQAGAYIGPETSKRLDEMADAAERASLRWRAFFANMISAVADWYERNRNFVAMMTGGLSALVEAFAKDPQRLTGAIGDAYDAAVRKGGDWIDATKSGFDAVVIAGARFVAGFGEAIASIPDLLGKAFVDGVNKGIEALESGLGTITTQIEKYAPWLGVKGRSFSFGRLSGGGASLSDRNNGIRAAEDRAEAEMRARGYGRDYRAEREQQRQIDFADWFAKQEASATGYTPRTTGAGTSTIKGAGDAAADRMAKALGDSARELDQARAFAEAANQGADAVARLEIHFKALKTAQDVFGKAANDNTKGVAELTARLEEQALATLKLKNLGDFRADTATLREQNEILEAEVRLANELPEVRARELAILKTMQEVKAKGLEGETEAIEQRRQAIEQNERLKAQGEEIKRSTELWTAPFKSALESIQRSTADWIESMLEGLEQGKFSMADFGKIGLSVLRRMAAEIISLAVMRPMLGSVVNGLASTGIISPGMASSLGYGSAGGGGGGFSLPGGSGLGNMFGGGGFFSQPIASLFSSGAPAGGYADVGALLASGNTGASAAASGIGGLGGISIGSALGAIGGIGMGAYQLFNSKSTGQTLGGIGTMIGAGVSLIPGIGQIAGPLIMMASALLPSLFGEPNTRTHSSTNASLRYGGGNWYTTGGAYGPGANSGQTESALRGTTAGIDALFDLMGGVRDPSKVWGLNLNSWTAQGKNWSYTSQDTALVDPTTGNTVSWRMNMDDMLDTGSAQLVVRSILSGAVGEISESMKIAATAMTTFAPTLKEVAENITFVEDVYDRFGKGALTVRAQFRELEKSFGDMTETAKKLGLALEPVAAEQKKQTERLGQDYIDNLIDPVAAQLRAWEDEKASILANVDYIARHTDVVVDMARINEALLRKEYALKDQLTNGAISQLEDAIRRLTYGDLSNLSGAGTLAGMRASFDATVAQARAGDLSAYQRVASEGLALTDASRSYFASSPEYEAIRREILAIFSELQVQISGGTTTSPSDASAANANTAAVLNTTTQLQAMVRDLTEQLAEAKRDQAETNDLIRRLLSRDAA
jgi:hypothetical protein